MEKPVVHYIKGSEYVFEQVPGKPQASLIVLNHPCFMPGERVTTSAIVEKREGGVIETLNTVYEPLESAVDEDEVAAQEKQE